MYNPKQPKYRLSVYETLFLKTWLTSQQTQDICIIFVQRWPNLFSIPVQRCRNVIQMFSVCWDSPDFFYFIFQLLSCQIIFFKFNEWTNEWTNERINE